MRVRFHPEKQYKGVELPLGKFAHDRESMLTQAQRHNVVRPLRTPPPKVKQVAQPADKEFLRTAEGMNFPIFGFRIQRLTVRIKGTTTRRYATIFTPKGQL